MKRIIMVAVIMVVAGCVNPFVDVLIPNQTALQQKPAVDAAAESSLFFADNVGGCNAEDIKSFADANAEAWKQLQRTYTFEKEEK